MDGIVRQSYTPGDIQQKELHALKNISEEMAKLQNGLRNLKDLNSKGRSASGRGNLVAQVLAAAQQLAAGTSSLANISAASTLASFPPSGVLPTTTMSPEERDPRLCLKAGKLGALEVMVLCGLMIELSVACLAVRNRLPHYSHIPMLLSLLTTASQIAFYPYRHVEER